MRQQTHWGENDPARRFANLNLCYYQAVADAFERDQIEGLTDEMTIGQLAGLLYEVDCRAGRKSSLRRERANEAIGELKAAERRAVAGSGFTRTHQFTLARRKGSLV